MLEWKKILDQAHDIQIKNVTDSLFKYAFIAITLGVVVVIFSEKIWPTIFLFSIGSVLIIFALLAYRYFAKNNPDYLRSEKYHLRKRSIELLGDKTNKMISDRSEHIVKITTSPYQDNDGNSKNRSIPIE